MSNWFSYCAIHCVFIDDGIPLCYFKQLLLLYSFAPDFLCTARGVPEVTVIDCTGNQPVSSLQCSFNGGQLHSCRL